MAEKIRVQKAIANAGLMSRRAAEDAIRAGRIQVDGRPVRLGDRVDVESQLLTLDGVPVPVDPGIETYLLYKPVGVVSTAKDPQGRTTVVDLVRSSRRLYPVGRLDADSEGLILVSNDGELTHRVTHPSFGITKTYVVLLAPVPTRATLRRLMEGVELEDGTAKALTAQMLDRSKEEALVEMVMVEGRNREIRRMCAEMGHEVKRLVRTAIGPVKDPHLKPGQSRPLTAAEIRALLESGSRR